MRNSLISVVKSFSSFSLNLLLAPVLAAAPLTSEMWAASQPVYQQTLAHPFLKGLSDGSLPESRFQFYLQQDALYLRAFAQALSLLAAKAPREDWAITLNQHAAGAIQVERQLHETLLKNAPRVTKMAPSNYAYTNHLLATAYQGTFAEGLAAVLPCYWIYWEVGKELKRRGSKHAAYQRWIDQYSGEEYGKVVRQVLDMMNAEGEASAPALRRRLVELFATSARYEYLFWDMAWKEEQWQP
jgi:thiaminase/transcriptional activator TenA